MQLLIHLQRQRWLNQFMTIYYVMLLIIWALYFLAVPVILILVLFGQNYSALWASTGIPLFYISCLYAGLSQILNGVSLYDAKSKAPEQAFTIGLLLLIFSITRIFLSWSKDQPNISPLLILIASLLSSIVLILFEINDNRQRPQTPWRIKIFSLCSVTLFGTTQFIITVLQQRDFLGISNAIATPMNRSLFIPALMIYICFYLSIAVKIDNINRSNIKDNSQI